MRISPAEVSDAQIVAALNDGWALDVSQVCYLPVGFGSHHWEATTGGDDHYFVTVDLIEESDQNRRGSLGWLDAAMRTAHAVADRLPEAVSPIPDVHGELVAPVGPAALTLFPTLRLEAPVPTPAKDRPEVIDVIGRLHALIADVTAVTRVDDLRIRRRRPLERTLGRGVTDRRAGPFSAPLDQLLAEHTDVVAAGLQRYDAVAAAAEAGRPSWVVTHGEPHPGNLLTTVDGLRLVDWDSVLIAPAARDLADFGEEAVALYQQSTGRAVPAVELELYRLRWELDEIAEYTAWFSRPHETDLDTETAWEGLTRSLQKLGQLREGAPGV